MMKADAIIFDKDGTLIDFDAFWIPVTVKAVEDVLAQFEKQDVPVNEIMQLLGVRDGVTAIDGVLCMGTYEQMGRITYEVLHRYGCSASCKEVTDAVIDAVNKRADVGEVKPTCPNLAEVLTLLKKQNKMLAVVTTDNEEITRKCLEKLGVEELFDKIYTDDGKTPLKPDPYCVEDFLRQVGTGKDNVVMVGDTMTDITFARNAGIAVIGMAKDAHNQQILAAYADAVITDPSHIFEVLN